MEKQPVEKQPERRIARVLSHNAVLASDGQREMVLVGRGIGFNRSEGDAIDDATIQQQYIEVNPEHVRLLTWISSLESGVVDDIALAVDLAADALGTLHPAVHVLLLDHIAFAVQRVQQGEVIENPLNPHIREMYPKEFEAAQFAVAWLNNHLAVTLPEDEVGFIALHLNAARTGETVKQPLQRANQLADLVDEVVTRLGIDNPMLRETILRDIVVTDRRLRRRHFRRNAAQHSIRRDLDTDYRIASAIICRVLDVKSLPRRAEGEAAYLAVQVHSWRQEADQHPHTNQSSHQN